MSANQMLTAAAFSAHLQRLSVRTFPDGRDGFDDELSDLLRIDHNGRSNLDELSTSSPSTRLAKNPFCDAKPTEESIARIQSSSGVGDVTYIDTNYIDARHTMRVPFVYIPTEAPRYHTVLDFWRMVIENGAMCVVMLGAPRKQGKVKSKIYWPNCGEEYDMGSLSVTTIREDIRQDTAHRKLLIRLRSGEKRMVTHLQYLTWPNGGIPDTSVPLVDLIETIDHSKELSMAPIIVHSSGEVGLTGVFIGMHIALTQFRMEKQNISILRIMHHLKLSRTAMVQRKDQYIFLYYAVEREMQRILRLSENGASLCDSSRYARQETELRASPHLSLAIANVRQMPLSRKGNPVSVWMRKRKAMVSSPPVPQANAKMRSDNHAPRDTKRDMAIMEQYFMQRSWVPFQAGSHTMATAGPCEQQAHFFNVGWPRAQLPSRWLAPSGDEQCEQRCDLRR